MEIVGLPREKSRIAKILRKLSEGFSVPEEIPAGRRVYRGPYANLRDDRIVVVANGDGLREHCGILLVGETCSICGVRPSWRDEP